MKKTKTSKDRSLQVSPDIRKLMIAHAREKGLGKIHVDKHYRVPVVLRKFILWMEFKNQDGTTTRRPHVEHGGLIDALHREGYVGLEDNPLEPVPCRKASCYGASELDYQQRATCKVTLKNGKWGQAVGDACRHNTTSMISGYGSEKGRNSLLRMAETRAMGRAITRLLNIPVLSIMELPHIDRSVVWKKNDKVLTPRGVEKIVEDQIIEAEFSPITDNEEETKEVQKATKDPAQTKALRELYKVIANLKLPVDPTKAHLRELAAMARHSRTPKETRPPEPTPIESLSDMAPLEIRESIAYLKKFTPGQVASLQRTFSK